MIELYLDLKYLQTQGIWLRKTEKNKHIKRRAKSPAYRWHFQFIQCLSRVVKWSQSGTDSRTGILSSAYHTRFHRGSPANKTVPPKHHISGTYIFLSLIECRTEKRKLPRGKLCNEGENKEKYPALQTASAIFLQSNYFRSRDSSASARLQLSIFVYHLWFSQHL